MYDQETDPYGDYYIFIFNTRSTAFQYYGIKLYNVKICLEYLYNRISNN